MMYKHLDYSRLNFLGKNSEPRITQEHMAVSLGRTSSGFRKAIKAGTIYAHELLTLAELFNMSVHDLVDFLGDDKNEVNENSPAYIKRKRLADTSDPLEWLRLAMSKSKQIDKLIDGLKD